jgi:hypothetical protein
MITLAITISFPNHNGQRFHVFIIWYHRGRQLWVWGRVISDARFHLKRLPGICCCRPVVMPTVPPILVRFYSIVQETKSTATQQVPPQPPGQSSSKESGEKNVRTSVTAWKVTFKSTGIFFQLLTWSFLFGAKLLETSPVLCTMWCTPKSSVIWVVKIE